MDEHSASKAIIEGLRHIAEGGGRVAEWDPITGQAGDTLSPIDVVELTDGRHVVAVDDTDGGDPLVEFDDGVILEAPDLETPRPLPAAFAKAID